MKKIFSFVGILLSLIYLSFGLGSCNSLKGTEQYTEQYTVNFQYSIGDGIYDYSKIYNEGDEISKPFDLAVVDNYYVLWTINGNDVTFPLTVNSDCTLVGNAYKYDNASDVVFLGGLVDYNILVEYIQENWTKRTLGNIETEDEDLIYYYIKYGISAEYNEIYFYPSDKLFKWSKTKTNNLTLGQVVNSYQYTSQITATYGETMDKASFQAVYACESIDLRNLVVRDSVSVSFKYQISKISTGILLQDFRNIKYTYSMSNPYNNFDDQEFAEELYELIQDSMYYFQNQLLKINNQYFVFF